QYRQHLRRRLHPVAAVSDQEPAPGHLRRRRLRHLRHQDRALATSRDRSPRFTALFLDGRLRSRILRGIDDRRLGGTRCPPTFPSPTPTCSSARRRPTRISPLSPARASRTSRRCGSISTAKRSSSTPRAGGSRTGSSTV